MAGAIKGLMRNILDGNDPYSFSRTKQRELLNLFEAKRYAKIMEIVEAQGAALQEQAAIVSPSKILKDAIQAKYALTFGDRGTEAIDRWNTRIKNPQISNSSQIVSLYQPQLQQAFAKSANSARVKL